MSRGVDFTPLVAARTRPLSTRARHRLLAAGFARFARNLGALAARLRQADRDGLLAALHGRMPPLAGLERTGLRAPHGAAHVLLSCLPVPRSLRACTPGHVSLPIVGATPDGAAVAPLKGRHAPSG